MRDTVLRIALLLILGAYAIVQASMYFTPAFVPDEVLFVSMTHDHAARVASRGFPAAAAELLFHTENMFGYGAAFWIGSILTALVAGALGVDAAWALRSVALLLFLMPPVLLACRLWRGEPRLGLILLALWLSTPLAWWYGKLISAEPLVFALAGFLLWFALRDRGRVWPASVLAGAIVGIKMSALPVAAFALIAIGARIRWRSWRSLAPLAGCAAGGFLAANPFILRDPWSFLLHLRSAAVGGPLQQKGEALWMALAQPSMQAWDLVPTGGAIGILWSIPAAIAMVAALATARLAGPVTLGLAVMMLTLAAALSVATVYFGWYLLPIAAAILFAFTASRGPNPRRDALLAGAALVNAIIMTPAILDGIRDRQTHARALAAMPSISACLSEVVRGAGAASELLDLSEVGQISAGRTPVPPSDWASHARVLTQWEAFWRFQEDGGVLLIGDRFEGARLVKPSPRPIQLYAGPNAQGEPGAVKLGRCGTVNVWRVTPPHQSARPTTPSWTSAP